MAELIGVSPALFAETDAGATLVPATGIRDLLQLKKNTPDHSNGKLTNVECPERQEWYLATSAFTDLSYATAAV